MRFKILKAVELYIVIVVGHRHNIMVSVERLNDKRTAQEISFKFNYTVLYDILKNVFIAT